MIAASAAEDSLGMLARTGIISTRTSSRSDANSPVILPPTPLAEVLRVRSFRYRCNLSRSVATERAWVTRSVGSLYLALSHELSLDFAGDTVAIAI